MSGGARVGAAGEGKSPAAAATMPAGPEPVATAPDQPNPVDAGALAFALVAAGAMAVYAYGVVQSSRTVADYILILPAAVIGAGAILVSVLGDIVRRGVSFAGLAGADRQPVLLLVLTGVYAATVPFVGFDVGTAAFIALALLIQGERRIWLLLLAGLLGSGLTVYLFHDLLMVRMPVLFL